MKKSGLVGKMKSCWLEECMNIELKQSILAMKRNHPMLTSVISPVIGNAFNIQDTHGDAKIE